MDIKKTGNLIKQLREEKRLTQTELGKLLNVSDKTISKWETGNGLPDISSLEPLARLLGISTNELMQGYKIENNNIIANMYNVKFYVCPICNNVISSIGECNVSCHGTNLHFLEAFETKEATIEKVEDELYVSIEHEMTKEHYISFVAGVSNDKVEIKKLYPEGQAECRLNIKGTRFIYFYDNLKGLFKQKVKR